MSAKEVLKTSHQRSRRIRDVSHGPSGGCGEEPPAPSPSSPGSSTTSNTVLSGRTHSQTDSEDGDGRSPQQPLTKARMTQQDNLLDATSSTRSDVEMAVPANEDGYEVGIRLYGKRGKSDKRRGVLDAASNSKDPLEGRAEHSVYSNDSKAKASGVRSSATLEAQSLASPRSLSSLAATKQGEDQAPLELDRHEAEQHKEGQEPPNRTFDSRKNTSTSKMLKRRRPRQQEGDAVDADSVGAGEVDTNTGSSTPSHDMPANAHQLKLLKPQTESVLRRLSESLDRGSLTMINLSQRGLKVRDANIIKLALLRNPNISVLKLSYNNLRDEGTAILASAMGRMKEESPNESMDGDKNMYPRTRKLVHHPSLSVLDLGFNNIGDTGCASLATLVIAGNSNLETLYLSGNNIRGPGAMALAAAIAKGDSHCGLSTLHLTANRIGVFGTRGLSLAITEAEGRRQQAIATAAATRNGEPSQGDNVRSIRELHLGGTGMGSTGSLAVTNMVLTNYSLRVLSLSDSGITDRDLALLSQSLSKNKTIPLEKIELSFNQISCVGVESFMNAVWGSKTLTDVRLDNNRIADRGAQLAAVTLTSVRFKILDLGFNRITAVGIKVLMKSLSENTSLESLILSGNSLDINAAKAVSYALAYNRTLKNLYIDNCSVGYAAQRHITAGIVSNPRLALKVITGFRLGSITVTLGLPPALDQWTNEKTLRFMRFMWERRREEELEDSSIQGDRTSSDAEDDIADSDTGEGTSAKLAKSGPADPTLVVSAAKTAFEALGDAGVVALMPDAPSSELSDGCPLFANDAVLLERTASGNIRAPLAQADNDSNENAAMPGSEDPLLCRSLVPPRSGSLFESGKSAVDGKCRQRLELWLRDHSSSINELSNLPFNDADLWQLHQYFFSPVGTAIFKKANDGPAIDHSSDKSSPQMEKGVSPPKRLGGLTRKVSFRHLGDAALLTDLSKRASTSTSDIPSVSTSGRRRSLCMIDKGEKGVGIPATKRARSNKPRIDYYPQIRSKLEALRYRGNQQEALVKMRQLKYVEGVMFRGRNISQSHQDEHSQDSESFTTSDVEAILLVML